LSDSPGSSVLWQRAAIIFAVRRFFQERAYLEVETPVRQPALIPESYIEPEQSAGWYLQSSPEICMKRLLAAGIPKLFQICKCFRRHERGSRHLPEFTMLEWYRADADYRDLMTECEALFAFIAAELALEDGLQVGAERVSLALPWERLTVADAFQRFAPLSLAESMERGLFEETFVGHVEPRLGLRQPCLLHDYPASMGSLARRQAGNPAVVERFELFVGGLELANGFSELTDVEEQRVRFEAEQAAIRAQGREPGPMPERFLEELARVPDAAGIALGLDRLVMLFSGAGSIDQVVAFTPEKL
jgi:lysyl-tRNA synthetase class 2